MNAVWMIITLLALCALAGVATTWGITWSAQPRKHVDWAHVAQMEREIYNEVLSPQAMDPASIKVVDKASTEIPQPPSSRQILYVREQVAGPVEVICRTNEELLGLDPAYEWVPVHRLGSPDVRYIRGPRKYHFDLRTVAETEELEQ